MLLLKALKNRSIFRLWLGQVGSSIGDEVFRVAFVWMSVELIGAHTGYLVSLQHVAFLIFGIFGAKWVDRLNLLDCMIWVDLFRAVVTLIPVFLYCFHLKSFSALVVSSVLLAGLGAFFTPALHSVLPQVTRNPSDLKAANGLMSTTFRLARVLGPALIGLLSGFISMIHFFTLNALSFFASAYSVYQVKKEVTLTEHKEPIKNEPILENLRSSFQILKTKPVAFKAILFHAFSIGAWYMIYGLGIALLVHEISPHEVKTFGMVMGAYGIGNTVSAIYFGNHERKRTEFLVYAGFVWVGISYCMLALSHTLPLLMFFSAILAFGGPMNNLPLTDMIQKEFQGKSVLKIFRLDLILETLGALIFTLISPLLFQHFEIRSVMLAFGLLIAGIALFFVLQAED